MFVVLKSNSKYCCGYKKKVHSGLKPNDIFLQRVSHLYFYILWDAQTKLKHRWKLGFHCKTHSLSASFFQQLCKENIMYALHSMPPFKRIKHYKVKCKYKTVALIHTWNVTFQNRGWKAAHSPDVQVCSNLHCQSCRSTKICWHLQHFRLSHQT